jgi:hypothetical protein
MADKIPSYLECKIADIGSPLIWEPKDLKCSSIMVLY